MEKQVFIRSKQGGFIVGTKDVPKGCVQIQEGFRDGMYINVPAAELIAALKDLFPEEFPQPVIKYVERPVEMWELNPYVQKPYRPGDIIYGGDDTRNWRPTETKITSTQADSNVVNDR